MDYTQVPRALIYEDRKDIDDFPISMQFGFPSMEGNFLEALEQRPFIKESYEAPELILDIFNNARYITTLICLEKHPNHYFRKYLRIAGSEDRSVTIANHAMPATMALVKNYLCQYMPNLYRGSKIVEDITNNFNTEAWKELTLGGQDDFYKLVIEDSFNRPGWVVDKNFEPRDIRDAVGNPLITARDISENIDYILESLKKGVVIPDEEIAPLNAMNKKVESWFPSDLHDDLHKELALEKIGGRLKKLDPNNAFEFYNIMNDMEKSLNNGTPVNSKTKNEIDKYLKKILGVGLDEIEAASVAKQDDDEIEKMNTKIKDFEEEYEALKAENKQLEQDNHLLKEEIEKLRTQTPETGELKAQVESMRAQIEDYAAKYDPQDLKKKKFVAMTGKQHVILYLAVLANAERLPNARKNLSWELSYIAARNQSTMEDYLKSRITQGECDALAANFTETPFIAKIIKELPDKLKQDISEKNRNKVLKNDKQ